MSDVVKLILTCQVKDDNIPQLMPLMWVISVVICLYIFIILINLYFYKDEYGLIIFILKDRGNNLVSLIW